MWQVSALQMHGTGTALGDPIEVNAALSFLLAPAGRTAARPPLALGAANGLLGAALVSGLPGLLPQLFTSSAQLWGPMRSVGPQAALAMVCCGVDVAATGVLLALRDRAYVVSGRGGGGPSPGARWRVASESERGKRGLGAACPLRLLTLRSITPLVDETHAASPAHPTSSTSAHCYCCCRRECRRVPWRRASSSWPPS